MGRMTDQHYSARTYRDSRYRLMLLGLLVEDFAHLELVIRRTIGSYLITDPVAARVLLANKRGIGALVTLANQLHTEATRHGEQRVPGDLRVALQRASAVKDRRNELFHNEHMSAGPWSKEVWLERSGQERQVIAANAEDFEALRGEVMDAITAVIDSTKSHPLPS